jgi:hypothetical protein
VADLADIRDGIRANIAAKFPDVQCTGYNITNALAPAFEVELDRIIYDRAMSRGLDEWFFTIRGFAASGTDKASQIKLDPWLSSTGAESVKAALESDRTLGGKVSDAHVVGMAKMAVFSPVGGSTSMFGAEWTLRVLAAGD